MLPQDNRSVLAKEEGIPSPFVPFAAVHTYSQLQSVPDSKTCVLIPQISTLDLPDNVNCIYILLLYYRRCSVSIFSVYISTLIRILQCTHALDMFLELIGKCKVGARCIWTDFAGSIDGLSIQRVESVER